ncbi:hypothetical protein ABT340_15735 [Streptosporangium sp. NPDC000239]|uniref:hypothetical protein n=1 Tax=Streptosporangium sp. NPDC000239 TaxID=3154248 RepID=UPI003321CAA2
MSYDPDAIVWKPKIPKDRKGRRVRYYEREDRDIAGAGTVTFTLAGGSGRWFVQRSHFGASPDPHRTRYFPNRRTATACFEHLAYG